MNEHTQTQTYCSTDQFTYSHIFTCNNNNNNHTQRVYHSSLFLLVVFLRFQDFSVCVPYVTQSIEFHSQINNFFLYLIEAIFKSNKKTTRAVCSFCSNNTLIPQITIYTLVHFISCAASAAASIATAEMTCNGNNNKNRKCPCFALARSQ